MKINSMHGIQSQPRHHLRCVLSHWIGVGLLLILIALPASGDTEVQFPVGPKVVANQKLVVKLMGQWIWAAESGDQQTCRLWRAFDIPEGAVVYRATLHISVDNGYRLLLDGREIGRGSDWRAVSIYDLTWLLRPGHHVLAVEGYNDGLQAGLNCGLKIDLIDRDPVKLISDESWRIAPNTDDKWAKRKQAPTDWPTAKIAGKLHQSPWNAWPLTITTLPPLQPPIRHFWQSAWFQMTMATLSALVLLVGIWLVLQITAQTKARRLLELERVRIAQDIHDDIGSQVTELLLLGEVTRRELPSDSATAGQINQICNQARGVSQALDDVVWAVNAQRDTVRDFTSHVCKYAQMFLNATAIRCRLEVETEIPATIFDLPVRRNLFLAVKEALNNAAKHSQADELFLRIYRQSNKLNVEVADNGQGFDAAQTVGGGNGVGNMGQRLAGIGGNCVIKSEPGAGCLVIFTVPITQNRRRWWNRVGAMDKSARQNELSKTATL
jgi:signal transduction histidine kinase